MMCREGGWICRSGSVWTRWRVKQWMYFNFFWSPEKIWIHIRNHPTSLTNADFTTAYVHVFCARSPTWKNHPHLLLLVWFKMTLRTVSMKDSHSFSVCKLALWVWVGIEPEDTGYGEWCKVSEWVPSWFVKGCGQGVSNVRKEGGRERKEVAYLVVGGEKAGMSLTRCL